MKTYLTYDSTGKVNGTGTSADVIPAGAIECSADIHSFPWLHTVVNGAIVAPSDTVLLEKAKSDQLLVISAACAAAIVGGFTSEALGDVYTYPSGITDQANLTAAVTASQLPDNAANGDWTIPFMCADVEGVWIRRLHTAVQIQKVAHDGITSIVNNMIKKDTLSTLVEDATTVAEVEAVTW